MSFSFLFEDDDENTFKAFIDDKGELESVLQWDDDEDPRFSMVLAGFGYTPDLSFDLHVLWGSITSYLEKQQLDSAFLSEVEKHETTQERWIHPGRWYDAPGHLEKYTYEFSLESFVGYLGVVISTMFDDYDDDVLDVAQLIAAIRHPDGKKLEFDIEDGQWEEATNNELGKMWAGVERTISADGEDMFTYTADWDREIYDPVHFTSEVDDEYDPHKLHPANSDELEEIIKLFGLKEKEEKLNKETLKTMPEPEYPESDPGGWWGVYYHYDEYVRDPETENDWHTVRTEIVVPYWSKEEAERALAIAKYILEDRPSIGEDFDIYIVKRISEEEQAQLQQAAKEREKERTFWKKQGKLFDIDTPPPIPFDPELDVWEKV